MTIDFNELCNSHWDTEQWNDIYKNIYINTDKVLNYGIKELCKNPNLTINFKIDTEEKYFKKDEINAFAKICDEENYSIVLSKKLIQLLSHFSRKIIDYEFIFSHIKRVEENRQILMELADFAFYIWIQSIFFHEFAHIVRGHLATNYRKSRIKTWYEISNYEVNKKLKKEYIKSLEADADKWGSTFMLGNAYLILEEMFKKHYKNQNEEDYLYDYILTIVLMYDLFERLEHKVREEFNESDFDHPHPEYRALISLLILGEDHLQNKVFTSIDSQKKMSIVMKAIQTYFLEFRQFSNTRYSKQMLGWVNFINKTRKILEKHKINKKTLFKKKDIV